MSKRRNSISDFRREDTPAADEQPLSNKATRKIRRSAAEQVVAQARVRNAMQGNVAQLPATRLERGKNVDASPFLVAVFPSKGGEDPDKYDLSFLLEAPGIADLFATAYLAWGIAKSYCTRHNMARNLRQFWIGYLQEVHLTGVTPRDVDEQVLAGFKRWLQRKKKRSGGPLHPTTISQALSSLRSVLDHVPEGRRIVERVPAGPRGVKRKSTPTKVLTFEQLAQIVAACEAEILALRDRWIRRRNLLKHGHRLRETGKGLERNPRERTEAKSDDNLALCLALLDHDYPGAIANLSMLRAHDEHLLGRTVEAAFGAGEIAGYFYPSSRDLVPLVVFLAIDTAFNPDAVLGLNWADINRKVDRLGQPSVQIVVNDSTTTDDREDSTNESSQVKITGTKRRANRQLTRLLDPTASASSQVSLNLVLDLLADMSARIRPHVQIEHADRVFLFVQQSRQKQPRGYAATKSGPSADKVWIFSISKFIEDNKLPEFSLKNLRATLMDFVQLRNRGDLEAARQVGNHASRITTWSHYTSDLVKNLLRENTGEVLLTRERWFKSGGKIDPRKAPKAVDKGCATPGFGCLDPFDSPRPNQVNGRLCNAYGECSCCPLVKARPGNVTDVVHWEALERAIYRSAPSVGVPVWRARWAPILANLQALLTLVPDDVLAESRRFRVELPNVG